MTRVLIVERGAQSDIEDGYDWYEQCQSGLGVRFVDEMNSAFLRIFENPGSYPQIMPEIRRAVAHTFPYLVFFTFDAQSIFILAVIPAAKDPKSIASRMLR